jgi:phage tail-like protein
VDVNGTKYHLLYGLDDWGSCLLAGSDQSLARLWDTSREHPLSPLEWDEERAALRLRREPLLFRRAKKREPALEMKGRRGAGRDRYGNWYWIDPDETGIRFLPPGEYTSRHFWSLSDWIATCPPTGAPADAQTFSECQPPLPPSLILRGLAVTTRHYLVVGYLATDNPAEHGLFLFDLHHGGRPPMQLRWPEDMHFSPWDLAPTPNGGVLILDHHNLTYWVLDAYFRLLAQVVDDQDALFQPQETNIPHNKVHGYVQPEGYSLVTTSPPGPLSPVSIEAGPDGRVYILDTDPSLPYSTVYEYRGATQLAAHSLKDVLQVMDPDLGEGSSELLSVIGHDFAYVEHPFEEQNPVMRQQPSSCGCQDMDNAGANGGAASPPVLYVALSDGYQVVAFQIQDGQLVPREDFYPLRHWGGKALVAVSDGLAYYDFADRWLPLQIFTECFYVGDAIITTPLPSDVDVPGQPFDSDIPGCVWHRLLLDAHIPAGCDVLVRARAADDLDLLTYMNWLPQPNFYKRSNGAELPFYDPWACDAWVQDPAVRDQTGTWEILFQEVKGRYLQLELTIQGTGRSTPALRALRAWYPRFSYLDHYLPAIYREEAVPASFLDRWLANFEGLYTNLEDKIDHVAELFDPCTVPAGSLDWLASWLGLALDPHWQDDRRRFFIRHAMDFYRLRGTLQGVEIAVRLYIDKKVKVTASLFDPRCVGQSNVRIVERFRTRGIGCQAYDPPDAKGVRTLRPITIQDVIDNAHRFTVLVPQTLPEDQLDIVQRIIALAKPAHTDFEVKRYWDMFRVGEAQLGLDTRLGESSQFSEMLLGGAYLADSYLPAPYPFDIADRWVSDRNRLGDLPPL